jgi:hypothetical protein
LLFSSISIKKSKAVSSSKKISGISSLSLNFSNSSIKIFKSHQKFFSIFEKHFFNSGVFFSISKIFFSIKLFLSKISVKVKNCFEVSKIHFASKK